MHRWSLGLVLALALGGEAAGQDDGVRGWPCGPGLGTAAGAVTGGLLGSAVAGRRNRTAAIVGGGALGAVAGSDALRHRRPRGRPSSAGRWDDRQLFLREAAARQELHERILRQHRAMGLAPPARGAATADEVRRAQRLLAALGHYRGPIDGIAGPATRAGISGFEAAQGMTPTGIVTPAILQRMRAVL